MELKDKFRISIIGTGYVGLTTGGCLSHLGYNVICVDNNKKKIESLKNLKMPIYEPGLEDLVERGVKKKKLFFTTSISYAVKNSDIIFIAVGTPSRENGEPDLSFIEAVSCSIAECINDYKLIIEKSTVPVETGKKIKETIKRYARRGVEFDIASNPEFLREGRAVKDFLHPERIVLGVESSRAEKILKRLYKPLRAPLVITDINTAEIIKHACNSFLATKISFINALSRICEKTGADIKKVSLGMGLDSRIGRNFLEAGIGFGGSCFPKDLDAFIQISKKIGYDFQLLEEVKEINISQRRHFVEKIKEELWILKNKTIAVLGISFKPFTDDIRESPSIDIIRMLKKEQATIKAYDPRAIPKAKKILKDVFFTKDVYSALKGADCLALVTAWEEFKNLDFKKIKKIMRYPFIIDGRNIYEPERLKEQGFRYIGMGR